ncbi:MAG: hypothetical protein Q6353_018140 [Candidatus Sigynarchaeum springense]
MNTAAICVVGTTVHVVYVAMNGRVQYTRRVGLGNTWELNHTLPGSVNAGSVAITASETQVWVLWRESSPRRFMLANGTGTSWTSETIVINVLDDYNSGTLLYKDGRLHVSWVNGNTLYYRCYLGTSIVIDETVTSEIALYGNPRIAVSDVDVYIAYTRQSVINCSYTKRCFLNLSALWQEPINFTRGDMYPYRMESEIAYDAGVIYFTWRSYRTTPTWHAQSHYITFNGTWSSMENVTVTDSRSPQLATSFEGIMLAVSYHPSSVVGLRYKYYPVAIKPHDDIRYVKGTTGNTISWIVKGHVHSTGNYQIFKNGASIAWAIWSNGSKISIVVDGLDAGTYNYTIEATDVSSNHEADTTFVFVIEHAPDNMSGLIAAIVIPCAIGGGLLVLFLLDKKKVIDLKMIFGKFKHQPSP